MKLLSGVRRVGGRVGAAFPSWAKPSRITAYTGIASGVMQLTLTPLSAATYGAPDSWLARLRNGMETFSTSKNPMDILGWDDQGGNALTIASLQLQQNAIPAVTTMAGFGIVAAVLKYVGL